MTLTINQALVLMHRDKIHTGLHRLVEEIEKFESVLTGIRTSYTSLLSLATQGSVLKSGPRRS